MQSRNDRLTVNGALILLVSLLIIWTQVCASQIIVGESCSGIVPGSKFVNQENCRTYFICSSGLYDLEYCPSGFYNPLKNDCDLDYKCKPDNNIDETAVTSPNLTTMADDDSTTTTYQESPTTTSSGDIVTTTTTTTTFMPTTVAVTSTTETAIESTTTSTTSILSSTTEATIGPYSCPSVDTEEPTYLNDRKSCEKYHLCYHTKPIEMHCAYGMYWNSEARMCDYQENVQCNLEGNGDASDLPKCSSSGTYSIAHPSQCENFLMCMEGVQTIQQCEAYHHWDVRQEKCVFKNEATCILDL